MKKKKINTHSISYTVVSFWRLKVKATNCDKSWYRSKFRLLRGFLISFLSSNSSSAKKLEPWNNSKLEGTH